MSHHQAAETSNRSLVRPRAALVGRMGVMVLFRVRLSELELQALRDGKHEPVCWFQRGEPEDGLVWVDTDQPDRFGWDRAQPAEPSVI